MYPRKHLTAAQNDDRYYQLSFDGLLCLGYISIKKESYDEGIQFFTKCISKSKKNKWAFAGIGYCKYEQGLYRQANEWFKKALRNDPSKPEFRGFMGFLNSG